MTTILWRKRGDAQWRLYMHCDDTKEAQAIIADLQAVGHEAKIAKLLPRDGES